VASANKDGRVNGGVEPAGAGFPAAVAIPGLRDLGDRQSWYGLAEVRNGEVTRSSMAHATSLGRTVAASGICAQWPRDTFRLIINAAGDALTITTAGNQASRAGKPARTRQARYALARDSAPAPAARPVPAPGRSCPGHVRPGSTWRVLPAAGRARQRAAAAGLPGR
jgi:hypothetical protein